MKRNSEAKGGRRLAYSFELVVAVGDTFLPIVIIEVSPINSYSRSVIGRTIQTPNLLLLLTGRFAGFGFEG